MAQRGRRGVPQHWPKWHRSPSYALGDPGEALANGASPRWHSGCGRSHVLARRCASPLLLWGGRDAHAKAPAAHGY
eukprot:scaffold2351_cov403-Prasinococcus_capsulatus_cf.AAC.1